MTDLVVLTRPEHRNTTLAARFKDDGINAACLPALRLQQLVSSAHHLLWPDDFDLLVFVSGHAAQLYLDQLRALRPDTVWPQHVLAATVGYASAEPLYQSDFVPAKLILHPEQGVLGQDSEGLWRVLQPKLPQIQRVLIVRGQAGREWLGAQFESHGVRVTRLSLYQREPEVWSAGQVRELVNALKGGQSPVFLLTSSESVDAVYANMQRLTLLSEWAQCRFIVIHERISTRLQTILKASGLSARYPVKICAPSDDAIYQAIRSTVSDSGSLEGYNLL